MTQISADHFSDRQEQRERPFRRLFFNHEKPSAAEPQPKSFDKMMDNKIIFHLGKPAGGTTTGRSTLIIKRLPLRFFEPLGSLVIFLRKIIYRYDFLEIPKAFSTATSLRCRRNSASQLANTPARYTLYVPKRKSERVGKKDLENGSFNSSDKSFFP